MSAAENYLKIFIEFLVNFFERFIELDHDLSIQLADHRPQAFNGFFQVFRSD